MAIQLRDYRIQDGALDQFIEEWRTQIAPLRRQKGFTIEGTWKIPEESRLLWLLAYPGDWDAFEAADRAYYESPERARIRPDPARLIEQPAVAALVRSSSTLADALPGSNDGGRSPPGSPLNVVRILSCCR